MPVTPGAPNLEPALQIIPSNTIFGHYSIVVKNKIVFLYLL